MVKHLTCRSVGGGEARSFQIFNSTAHRSAHPSFLRLYDGASGIREAGACVRSAKNRKSINAFFHVLATFSSRNSTSLALDACSSARVVVLSKHFSAAMPQAMLHWRLSEAAVGGHCSLFHRKRSEGEACHLPTTNLFATTIPVTCVRQAHFMRPNCCSLSAAPGRPALISTEDNDKRPRAPGPYNRKRPTMTGTVGPVLMG